MSNITNIQNQQPIMQNQQVQTANETTAPAVLQKAKPSVGSTVCRVLAGIFSLGLSEGVFAICRHIKKNAAQVRGAGEALPAAEPAIVMQNRALSTQFKNDSLPPEFKAAVAEAFSELRAGFGEKVLPKCSTVQEFLANTTIQNGFRKEVIKGAANAIKNSQTEISPQDLKNCIIEKASPKLASLAAHVCILEQAENKISSDNVITILNVLSKTNTGFNEGLAACKNAEDVKTYLAAHPKFTDTVEYTIGYCTAEKKTDQYIIAELAKVTGKSEQEIQKQLKLNDVKTKYPYGGADETGTVKERLEQLETKFHDIAAKFIQTKTELYNSIASLTVSEGLKEQMRNDVLSDSTLKKGYVFSRAEQAVSQVDVSSLIRVLKEGNAVSDLDLVGMLNAVSVQLSDSIASQYKNTELAELGAEGNAITVFTACQILLDKNPEIVDLIKSDPAKLNRLIGTVSDQKADADEQLDNLDTEATRLHVGALYGSRFILNTVQGIIQVNNSVVSSLQTGTGEGQFAQIMHDTLVAVNEEYGVNIGTNLNEVDNLPFGEDVIKNIESRISAQNQPLSSAQFTEIVRSELREHVANLAAKTAISERCAELGLNSERVGTMLSSLKYLYLPLQESISKADNKEMIQALLLSCDKYENILHRESDIATYSAQITKDTHARLAELLGVDAADVPKTMNLDKLREGFLIVAKDISDKGNTSEDGSVPDIQERFQHIADRFVKGKSDLYAFVNDLAVSPALKTTWRNEINTNTSLKNPVLLQGAYNVAQRMDGSSLAKALHDGLNQSELLGLVKSLSAQIDVYAHQVFTQEQFNAMGSDETALISFYARNVFWDKNGKLKVLLMDNEEMMKGVINELGNELSTIVSQLTKTLNISGPEADKIKQDMAFIVNAQALLDDVFHK